MTLDLVDDNSAFTPGCSKTHLPGYVAAAESLKATKGVSDIVCVAVNDPFVMEAWGKAHAADGKVRMLADTTGAHTKALGLDLDLTAALGGVRTKRFSAVVENGVVTKLNVEVRAGAGRLRGTRIARPPRGPAFFSYTHAPSLLLYPPLPARRRAHRHDLQPGREDRGVGNLPREE